jgi:hypothetical protein
MTSQLQGLGQTASTQTFEAHIQSVRLFMRDFSMINLLIRGEESSDRMIAWATLDFLSNFNGTPPFSRFTLDDMLFSYNLQHFAVRGTVISLLQSLMLVYARNHLPFSDGGLSVNFNDKAPLIQSMLQLFQAAYEQDKRQIKTAINVAGIMDAGPSGVHSDYYALSAIGFY